MYRLQVNRWRKIKHVNTNQKKVRVAIINFRGVDFKSRKVIADKRKSIIITGSVLRKDTAIPNV
jgi:hypothetical protein